MRIGLFLLAGVMLSLLSCLAAKAQTDALYQKAKKYAGSQPDSALYWASKAQEQLPAGAPDSLQCEIRLVQAAAHIQLQQLAEAEKLLQQNLGNCPQPRLSGLTYAQMGNMFSGQQQPDKAMAAFLQAARLLETTNDSLETGKVYMNIGTIEARQKNYDQSIGHLRQALQLVQQNELTKINVLINLSAVYFESKNVSQSLETADTARQLAEQLNAYRQLATIYNNISNYNISIQQYNTAIEAGKKSLLYKLQLKMPAKDLAITYNNIGYSYLNLKQYDSASFYLPLVLEVVNPELKLIAFNNLRRLYEEKKNYEKALSYANQYNTLKDSIYNSAQHKTITELVEKYESEKKQQQINLLDTQNKLSVLQLTKQKYLLWLLLVVIVLAGIAVFMYYRHIKTSQSLKMALLRQKLLQAQLNPHFLFHALNSIQAFIYQNKKEESFNYLASYSKLMRSVLESADQDFITVQQDAEAIQAFMTLHTLQKSFVYAVELSPEVEEQELLIPPMFTQPHVENAILHGLANKTDGQITVHYGIVNNQLQVTITDNGTGMQTMESANKLHRSMSMDILKERALRIREAYQYNSHTVITSSENGTEVQLSFPVKPA